MALRGPTLGDQASVYPPVPLSGSGDAGFWDAKRILKMSLLRCFSALFLPAYLFPAPQAGSSCRSPPDRPLLLTPTPGSHPAAVLAQGEPRPPGPLYPAALAFLPPPLATPACPPGASPCPAKKACPPHTKPGPGCPQLGVYFRPEHSLIVAPPPWEAPRKDPEGNSRLSVQQPKAGRGVQRARQGPDNDAHSWLSADPTLAWPPICNLERAQHSLMRPKRTRLHPPGPCRRGSVALTLSAPP